MRQLTGWTKCVSATAGAAAVLLAVSGAHGQACTPEFADGFAASGVNGPINASIMYDAQDGNGPRLYVAGQFSRAGGKLCNGIAMWNGTEFEPLGGGLPSNGLATSGSGIVYDLEVFDPDGDGPIKPELWAGGSFARARQPSGALVTVNGVARWNGSTQTWASVPLSGGVIQVLDLMVDNHVSPVPGDNDGPRIYLANTMSTGTSRYITAYRWNGSSYSQIFIGEADGQPILDNVVWCLGKYNGRVYFGGAFLHGVGRITEDGNFHEKLPVDPAMAATNVGVNNISPTASMVAYNGRLLIGPQLSSSGGSGVGLESFDGTSWQPEVFGPLGSTAFSPVGQMEIIDLGDGPKLYMGDMAKNGAGFNTGGDLPPEYKGGAVWDGTSLLPFGDGTVGNFEDAGTVYTFTKTTIRNQPAVFMGGIVIGGRNADASFVRGQGGVFWGGSEWIPQYTTVAKGGFSGGEVIRLDGVNDVIVNNGDAGVIQNLYNNPEIVRYNGEGWASSGIPVPTLVSTPRYIRYDDGTGEALFAYGQTMNIDPAQFSVQKWNAGSQEWVSVSSNATLPGSTGQGLPAGFVRTATLFDPDGAGPERTWLVIAGTTSMDNNFAAPPAIVAYTGTQWVVLGSGLPDGLGLTDDANVTSLAVFDDGSGPKLFATGAIFEPGAGTVARYDGTGTTGTWTIIGQSGGGKLRVLDLGSGPQLYLYGGFSDVYVSSPNAVPTGPVARWTGTDWVDGAGAAPLVKSAPQSPFAVTINDLCVFDDGSGPAMYAVGPFGSIGGTLAQGIAKYNGTAWSALGLGLNSHSDNLRMNPVSLVVYDDDGAGGVPPALYVAGGFDNANGTYSERFARFGCTETFCAGDFNASGTTTADDIFAFLDAWFAQNGSVGPGFSADVDGNQTVTADDIFSFLDSWFLCNG